MIITLVSLLTHYGNALLTRMVMVMVITLVSPLYLSSLLTHMVMVITLVSPLTHMVMVIILSSLLS